MTPFRFAVHRRTPADREPEPGDEFISAATGRRWLVVTVRRVRQRKINPEYPRVFMAGVQRVADDAPPAERAWPFERGRF